MIPSSGASGQYLRLETPGTPRLMRRGGDARACECACASVIRVWMQRILGWLCGGVRPASPDVRRGAAVHDRVAQYQAPAVSPPRASSSSSLGECDHEHGTLLPKRATPEPGPSSSSASARAATAAALDSMLQELPRHRRTGSGASGGRPWPPAEASNALAQHVRGAAGASGSSSSSTLNTKAGGGAGGGCGGGGSKLGKGGLAGSGLNLSEDLEGGGVGTAMLLGGEQQEDEDDDCCPTCLEVYTTSNPRIWTQCGHHFHIQCIYAWLERKETCPLCESHIHFEEL